MNRNSVGEWSDVMRREVMGMAYLRGVATCPLEILDQGVGVGVVEPGHLVQLTVAELAAGKAVSQYLMKIREEASEVLRLEAGREVDIANARVHAPLRRRDEVEVPHEHRACLREREACATEQPQCAVRGLALLRHKMDVRDVERRRRGLTEAEDPNPAPHDLHESRVGVEYAETWRNPK